MPESGTEIVLTTRESYEPDWKVDSADDVAEVFDVNGGRVLVEPIDIPIGRLAVVEDPFGNRLVCLTQRRAPTTPMNPVRSPASRDHLAFSHGAGTGCVKPGVTRLAGVSPMRRSNSSLASFATSCDPAGGPGLAPGSQG